MTMPSRVVVSTATTSGFALGFIALCMVMYILHIGRDIIIPFVVALFVWYLINALARSMTLIRLGKKIPSFWRFFIAIVALVGVLSLVVGLISQNIREVMVTAPQYQKSFEVIVPKFVEFFGLSHVPTVSDLMGYIDLDEAISFLGKTFTGITGKFLIVLFYVGFLLYEQRYFNRKLIGIFVDRRTERSLRRVLRKIDIKIQRYIGVKALVSAFDSFLTYVILSSMGVDFAEFWGVMAFFLHFVPYAGSLVAISMPSAIALIQFGDPTKFMVVAGALCTSHAFIGHVLDPYLMGNNLNLSPIFIISSLAMWGMIWGVPGMFLAIPILAALTITLAQFPRTRSLAVLISKTGELEAKTKKRRPAL